MESLYSRTRSRAQYLAAPCLKEREQFLAYRLSHGYQFDQVKATSALLLGVVSALRMTSFREVTVEEIEQAADRWCRDSEVHVNSEAGHTSRGRFVRAAKRWFIFHKSLRAPQPRRIHFASVHEGFVAHLIEEKFARGTIKSWKCSAKVFLVWLAKRHSDFAQVSLKDVDEFVEDQMALGWKVAATKTRCQGLRKLFRYAEKNGMCPSTIAQGIVSPRAPLYSQQARGPSWRQVRKIVATAAAQSNSLPGLRAHAMLCLTAVYALRAQEVSALQLADLDWRKELLLVRRAKGGRVQQYPLQFEVGEALIRYLREARPACSSRHVFLTIKPPFRPVSSETISQLVQKRMNRVPGISCATVHGLRHACATELLHQGSSLQYISEFLGHKDPKSVSIYARYDTRTLTEVADFSMAGVL